MKTLQKQTYINTLSVLLFLLIFSALLIPAKTEAMPVFARKYDLSCNTCHAAFPRLNEFGQQFAANNMRLPNWKNKTINAGDDMLALPESVPLAMRMQAFAQAREAEAVVDFTSGKRVSADGDIQSPYLIKLLSSAPLSEHISYYFYGIFAEKGDNGSVILEDAWFSHDAIFNTDISMMIGQFQVSDLMFPREVRLTFQDYMVYRMAGITYDRGILFGLPAGPLDLSLGVVNGNGVKESYSINSPGFQRSDHLFDNNNDKSVFGRIGGDIAGVNIGLFGYSGTQKNVIGPAGTVSGDRDTDKISYGIDLSGKIGAKTYWFAQLLQNNWDEFIDINTDYSWFGGFIGVDYIHSDRWSYSLLYNYTDANDFENTDTVYEGLDMNTVTLSAGYYFMRNVKGVIEINVDLLDTVDKTGTYWTGHLTGEDYALVGIDAAF
ncbi:MAG: hypothetical protein PF589_08080 [Gammaproteobacteria bacterium]|jgi:hypothetical protein|nr:hypothetical protein [Gammaproteobacteria bacterium]